MLLTMHNKKIEELTEKFNNDLKEKENDFEKVCHIPNTNMGGGW